MRNKIYKTENNLVIEIPLKQDIDNPYTEEIEGEMENIAGLITKDEFGNTECGFSHLIDRSYKDKEPDISPLFYHYWNDVEEFKKLCKELDFDIYEIPMSKM